MNDVDIEMIEAAELAEDFREDVTYCYFCRHEADTTAEIREGELVPVCGLHS